MVEESYFDELDRTSFNLADSVGRVFDYTYGWLGCRLVAPLEPNKFDNAASLTAEIGVRVLIVLGSIAAMTAAGFYLLGAGLVLGVGREVLKQAGFYFQKGGFTHIRGKAPEVKIGGGQASVMTWNIAGEGYEKGVVHWSSRIDRIAERIKSENPHVVVLQGVNSTALIEALVEKLGDRYAHFFGYEGNLMVITQCPYKDFTDTRFIENGPEENCGFATLEINGLRIIGTELASGKGAEEIRSGQMKQIIDALAAKKVAMPTLFVGDAHFDRDGEEGQKLSKSMYHSYWGEPTQTNGLARQWTSDQGERVEETSSSYISLVKCYSEDGKRLPVQEKGIALVDSRIVPGYGKNYDTQEALSHSHAIVTTIQGLPK
ncbi:MAG: endonuclease/exonuclease/phosphatase family protein [Chlamydiales bacterium]